MKTVAFAALAMLAAAGGSKAQGLPLGPFGVTLSDERAERAGIGGAEAEGPGLGGEWSRLDACAWIAWDVEFLMWDVNAFLIHRNLGVHEETEEAGPVGAEVVEMARSRAKWSFYAAKGLEKSLAVLCPDVQYEGKAEELLRETFRRSMEDGAGERVLETFRRGLESPE